MYNKTKNQLPILDSFNDDNIKVFALGGLGEVGKNLYCLECEDELILIDSGILFPDSAYGVDYVIPDYTYLIKNVNKIKALFITHGHEDHIGGIPYLLREINLPVIYAAGLAVKLIENKLNEFGLSANIQEYNRDSVFKYKNFEISFIKTNHSIPDSYAIAAKTRLGYIIHSGDFKFDFTPLGGHTDYERITKYASEGVLCLLSDSTNANITKFSVSEKKIGDSIKNIFSTVKGRILISTFASNVHRVQQIIEASIETGRQVVVFGRSMERTVDVARKIKYIDVPENTFISPKDCGLIDQNKLTVLTTGSQGEPLAALSRIADGTHRYIKLMAGDTIIFSSSAIPGNQESINRTINKLYRAEANVIVNSPLTDTHTSGHASEIELEIMLALVKPKYFTPIHGEYSMQKKHIELAVATGVPKENCFLLNNGQVLTFNENKVFSLYSVKAGIIYIDSDNYDIDNTIIRERKLLSEDGLLVIVYTLDKFSNLVRPPSIISRGFIYVKNSEALMREIKYRSVQIFNSYFRNQKKSSSSYLSSYIINELTNFISSKTDRKPIIMPIMMNISASKYPPQYQ